MDEPKTKLPRRLRRYTKLRHAMALLDEGKLTLTDPATWEDRNDVFNLECVKAVVGFGSVRICCLAANKDTFHHWKVFTGGRDGVGIIFDVGRLAESLTRAGVPLRPMRYRNIPQIQRLKRIRPEDLPYLKWERFADEQEHRAVWTGEEDLDPSEPVRIPIELAAIESILISPLISDQSADAISDQLKVFVASRPRLKHIDILRSRTSESERWKRLVAQKLFSRRNVKDEAIRAPAKAL